MIKIRAADVFFSVAVLDEKTQNGPQWGAILFAGDPEAPRESWKVGICRLSMTNRWFHPIPGDLFDVQRKIFLFGSFSNRGGFVIFVSKRIFVSGRFLLHFFVQWNGMTFLSTKTLCRSYKGLMTVQTQREIHISSSFCWVMWGKRGATHYTIGNIAGESVLDAGCGIVILRSWPCFKDGEFTWPFLRCMVVTSN